MRLQKTYSLSSFQAYRTLWLTIVTAQTVKNLPVMLETQVRSLGRKDPLEEGLETYSVFLSGESHGERSLAGYSPWGHKESDMTEQLTLTYSHHTVHQILITYVKTGNLYL